MINWFLVFMTSLWKLYYEILDLWVIEICMSLPPWKHIASSVIGSWLNHLYSSHERRQGTGIGLGGVGQAACLNPCFCPC